MSYPERKVEYEDFASLRKDVTDMKELMTRMVEAMARITIIEERQHSTSVSINKVLERIEQLTNRQHEHEVQAATNRDLNGRVEAAEQVFRELHIENERNKARFHTVVWTVRALWAVIVVGAGALGWFLKG